MRLGLFQIVIFAVFFSVTSPLMGTELEPPRPTLKMALGVSLNAFDPSEAEDFVTIRVLMNLGRGLVSLDSYLKPIPGLAKSWSVSPDRRTYRFKLSKSFWSDGAPVTANEFVQGFERTFSPKTIAKIAMPLIEVVDQATEYKTNALKDFSKVGVRALSNDEVEIRLKKPAPYFLSLLALPIAFPQRLDAQNKGTIGVGTPTCGPFIISELKPASHILLTPNSHYSPKPDHDVDFQVVLDSSTQLALYEKKQIDVLEKIPSSDFTRFEKSPELVTTPFLATYYLAFNVSKPPFSNLKLRKAIAQAISRDELKKIFKDPVRVASSLVPSPLPNSEQSFGFSFDAAEAKKLWQGENEHPKSLVFSFDNQEKNILIASLIQSQLKKNLDLDINLRSMEWKSYIKHLSQDHPSFFRFAWLAAFPDPLSHLGVFTSKNPNNYTGYANPEYDALVTKIAETPPGRLRLKLISDAQRKLLTEDLIVIPLYHYVQSVLINPRWRGLAVTPMGLLGLDQAHLKP